MIVQKNLSTQKR